MAKTVSIEVTPELEHLYDNAIERRDRFILGVAQGHKREPSKARKKKLKNASVINSPQEGEGSILKYLSPFWRALTDEQKLAWKTAGAFSFLNGWQLFVSDSSARIRNDITFPVAPSNLWQVKTGHIVIADPASELIIKQDHPLDYLVVEPIPGRAWKDQIVTVKETFTLPVTLKIRYKSDFSAFGAEQIARYKITVWTSYQGEDIFTDFSIDFDPVTDWKLDSVVTSNLRGIIIGYTLYIEIVGYRGELLFDNIEATHSGTNWALDPRCDEINKVYEKAFALVPPFWVPVSQPVGATFSSIFPPVL